MRKTFLLLTFLLTLSGVLAYETTVHVFYGSGCPHCAEERAYLKELDQEGLTIKEYEISYNESNYELYLAFAEAYNSSVTGAVPVTYVGDKIFIGYTSQTGGLIYSSHYNAYNGYQNQICSAITQCVNEGCVDPLKVVSGEQSLTPQNVTQQNGAVGVSEAQTISLPIIGDVDVTETSIFMFTIIVGLLDGFNPCAMWMLSFLLAFTIATRDRKKVFIIGGIFILVSGIVYFLFITAWLNLFISMTAVKYIRIAAGLFALTAGLINIKDYFAFQKGLSLTIPKSWQPWIKKKMKYISGATGLAMIGGTILLAFSINLVELMCTIGFPVIYLNVLATHGFTQFINYLFLGLYVLMYMLDDTVIFLIAVFTLQRMEMSKKKVKLLKLISGLLITGLALVLIFKPELLMFG